MGYHNTAVGFGFEAGIGNVGNIVGIGVVMVVGIERIVVCIVVEVGKLAVIERLGNTLSWSN